VKRPKPLFATVPKVSRKPDRADNETGQGRQKKDDPSKKHHPDNQTAHGLKKRAVSQARAKGARDTAAGISPRNRPQAEDAAKRPSPSTSKSARRFAAMLRSKPGVQFVEKLLTGKVFELIDINAVKELKLGRDGQVRVLKRKPPKPKAH
jgi:hypothetical protein